MTNPQPADDTPVHPVHRAAVDAWHAGLCPIPAAVDGTKRPAGQWKQYQTARPTLEQVHGWFRDGHPGWGVICGAVSGNLEMLELEGRAVDDGLWDRFSLACDDAGIGHVLDRIIDGYGETTPSRGIHLPFHVDGTPMGNTKLARRADREVLMETRGEGGFVILAPSHGPTHPSGLAWINDTGSLATLATITAAERDALYAVAASFDEADPTDTVTHMPQPIALAPYRALSGESWIDELLRELARRPWGDILAHYGFAHHHDAGEVAYWTRPGKDTAEGYSATTNAKGTDRLIVFSTSMPLKEYEGGLSPAPSYDRLDVIAAYEYHGDRLAAARALAGRNAPTPASPPPGVDPVTGEVDAPTSPPPGGINLPDEFWDARPSLQHIRTAAHSRTRSADAVLVAVLSRICATIHPTIRLPAITGSKASLNFLAAIIARSGAGKSTANDVAAELVPIHLTTVVADVPLGSGEGLVELYFEWRYEDNEDGKKVRVKRQAKDGAFVYLDEGQALAEMGGRKGATLLPTLRSAWSGGVLGQSNASQETHRVLAAHKYRLAVLIGFQLEYAAGLVGDGAGGTPQRFIFATATDPSVPDEAPEWPGELDYTPPPVIGERTVEFHPDIAAEVRAKALAVTRGDITIDPLDSHRDLVKMKTAALLAILDGRLHVDNDDWHLAGIVADTSNRVRRWIVDERQWRDRQAGESRIYREVATEAAKDEAHERRALESGAKSIRRLAEKAGAEGVTKRQLTHAVSSRNRSAATLDDMIAHAGLVTMGDRWVLRDAP